MLKQALKMLADTMSGPPAAVERNPASFNGACFMCGWESTETIEGAVTKHDKCPRCGANLDQPMALNTAPSEEFLPNPKEIASKEKA